MSQSVGLFESLFSAPAEKPIAHPPLGREGNPPQIDIGLPLNEKKDTYQELERKYPGAHFYPVETEGSRFHTEVTYPEDVFFVFGKETKGLPKAIVEKYADTLIRLPMRKGLRSLNLSNAAAVMVYEALRQRGFEGLV